MAMNGVTIERAHRMDGTGEYYFSRRLREIAEIEAATGRQIIKLAMGSPDLPPHPSVIERLSREAQRPDVHKYMSFKGSLSCEGLSPSGIPAGTAWSWTGIRRCCR